MADTTSPEPAPAPAPDGSRAERRGKLVTTRYAADYCGVSTNTIRRWIDQGQLCAYRIGPNGARIRVDLDSVAALVVPV